MGTIAIIDASAVLAYLQEEKGEEVVESALDAGPVWITTVNACEVLGKLCEKGMPASEADAALSELGLTEVVFDGELARLTAKLRVKTMGIGASLGDRACLALAERAVETSSDVDRNTVLYTAERSWAKLKW